ncbi:MAG: exodeoxyribonuclease VII small subunit [Candidatus Azotimanducaceae bacterium]
MTKKKSEEQSNDAEVDFESALKELETLVSRMESGELSLDESLKAFERGVELTRKCQSSLEAAELRVQTLTKDKELKDSDLEIDEQ